MKVEKEFVKKKKNNNKIIMVQNIKLLNNTFLWNYWLTTKKEHLFCKLFGVILANNIIRSLKIDYREKYINVVNGRIKYIKMNRSEKIAISYCRSKKYVHLYLLSMRCKLDKTYIIYYSYIFYFESRISTCKIGQL